MSISYGPTSSIKHPLTTDVNTTISMNERQFQICLIHFVLVLVLLQMPLLFVHVLTNPHAGLLLLLRLLTVSGET